MPVPGVNRAVIHAVNVGRSIADDVRGVYISDDPVEAAVVRAPWERTLPSVVVLPEYVARSWWERLLYNQSTKALRRVLLGRTGTVIVNVPYRREDAPVDAPRPPVPPVAS